MGKVLVFKICLLFIGLTTHPAQGKESNKGLCEICGKSNTYSRIYNGRPVQLGEIPWRVSIIDNYKGTGCGGSIISKNWVLTAAHCVPEIVEGAEHLVNLTVRAGTLYNLEGPQTFQIRAFKSFIRHNFRTSALHVYDDDIALIKVPDPGFDFSNPNVGPICLPYRFKNKLRTGQALASGWGFYYSDFTTNKLVKATVTLGDFDECDRILKRRNETLSMSEKQLCISSSETQICPGDSGGSIDIGEKGRLYAYGINSFVTSDCGHPSNAGFLTRVDAYLDWIEEKTGETFCTE